MASVIKRREKYYARIRWYLTNSKREEIQIPLKKSKFLEFSETNDINHYKAHHTKPNIKLRNKILLL